MYRYTDGIPRRINTLCSRVLLYGAIEETHTITGPMVETTANELRQDLGAGLAAPQPAAVSMSLQPATAPNGDALVRRIEALEQNSVRQDRVFRRVIDLLSAVADR
jgi:general secretion pathway protein A